MSDQQSSPRTSEQTATARVELSAEEKHLIDKYVREAESEKLERRNKYVVPWTAGIFALSTLFLTTSCQYLTGVAGNAGREAVEKSGQLLDRQKQALDELVSARSSVVGAQALANQLADRSKELLKDAVDQQKTILQLKQELETARASLATAAQYQKITGDIEVALRANPEIAKSLGASFIMPTGMVAAFNNSQSQGCPSGWALFEQAKGRFVVGAGPHSNLDTNGNSLTIYPSVKDDPVKSLGGAERHRLTIEEMPAHSHVVYPHAGLTVGTQGRSPGAGSADPNLTSRTNGLTSEVGGNQPHSIRPPYVALYFCVKQ